MKSFSKFKKEQLQDPAIRQDYDRLEVEFSLLEDIIKKRLDKGLTQKQLAELVGTRQSAISRFESGTYNPTLQFLQKIATALDAKLQIRIS